MSTVLMTIGNDGGRFRFSVSTAAFQQLTRSTQWAWADQQRLWGEQARQFVGKGLDKITLRGQVLPHWNGGGRQIERLRNLGDAALKRAEPLLLVSGMGDVFGMYVITALEEEQGLIGAFGQPLEQQFTLTLAAYGEDGGGEE